MTINRKTWALLAGGLLSGGLTGCQTNMSGCDRLTVAGQIQQRSGHAMSPDNCRRADQLGETLTEERAVVLALWNNASFQEQLVDLGIARADLITAGLLPNPEFVYLFEVKDKPLRYAIDFPVEALWLRPIRVRAAQRESAKTCDRLVQAGLNLIRDVRQAYADVLLAKDRYRIAQESTQLRQKVSDIAETRLRAGDASPQEASIAKLDLLQAQQDRVKSEKEIPIAEERLRNLLGLGANPQAINLDASIPPMTETPDLEGLVNRAVTTRPDAQSAEEAIGAAEERLRLAKIGWIRFLGVADATSGKRTGHEFGPAVRVTVPIFNWNQGNIAKAEAELEKADWQLLNLQDQIRLDVRKAYAQYDQARSELAILQHKTRPEVDAAIRRVQKGYQEGNTNYVIVLETSRQLIDTSLREAQLNADLRRAWAELERSVGVHVAK